MNVDGRRDWVAHVEGDPFCPDMFVLIEQYPDRPPDVTIRLADRHTYGIPHTSEERA